MSLVAQDLADKIINEIGSEVATMSYLRSIKDYIEANIEFSCEYVGMTTSVPPVKDPAKVEKAICTLNPTMPLGAKTIPFLSSLKEPNPDMFLTTIFLEMVPITVSSVVPVIFSTTMIYSLKSMTPDLGRLKESKDYKENWLIFAEHIVDTCLTFTAVPPAIPSTSVTPGSGVTTILKVS